MDQLCVHCSTSPTATATARLRRSAAVGLAAALLDAVESLPDRPGRRTARHRPPPAGEAVVVEDVRRDPRWTTVPRHGGSATSGPRSSWSVPIVGSARRPRAPSPGTPTPSGRPQADQLELVSLYASHAAAAIEREHLLADATRRNRVLETLRGVLDTLAGPQPAQGGLARGPAGPVPGSRAPTPSPCTTPTASTPSSRRPSSARLAAAMASPPAAGRGRADALLDRAGRPGPAHRRGRPGRADRRAGGPRRGHGLVGRPQRGCRTTPSTSSTTRPGRCGWPSNERPSSRPTPRRRPCDGRTLCSGSSSSGSTTSCAPR